MIEQIENSHHFFLGLNKYCAERSLNMYAVEHIEILDL